MKRYVLTFGLLSGAAAAAMMLAWVPYIDTLGFEYGAVFGYTAIVAAFLFVFFGIKAYRDNELGGAITFGRAFAAGLLMTIISSLCYVAAWQFVYFRITPDFFDKYAVYSTAKARAAGESEEKIASTAREMTEFKKLYDKPLVNAVFTFIEPFPVGLLMTLVSAAALRKKAAG